MSKDRSAYMGPRLRRLRREMGLTQAVMADDLGVSASYIALMERNQRPMTTDMLLRLAQAYKLDIATLAGTHTDEYAAQLGRALRDPIFSDIDIAPLDIEDVTTGYPGVSEAILRLYNAYQEGQLALAFQVDVRKT